MYYIVTLDDYLLFDQSEVFAIEISDLCDTPLSFTSVDLPVPALGYFITSEAVEYQFPVY